MDMMCEIARKDFNQWACLLSLFLLTGWAQPCPCDDKDVLRDGNAIKLKVAASQNDCIKQKVIR